MSGEVPVCYGQNNHREFSKAATGNLKDEANRPSRFGHYASFATVRFVAVNWITLNSTVRH